MAAFSRAAPNDWLLFSPPQGQPCAIRSMMSENVEGGVLPVSFTSSRTGWLLAVSVPSKICRNTAARASSFGRSKFQAERGAP